MSRTRVLAASTTLLLSALLAIGCADDRPETATGESALSTPRPSSALRRAVSEIESEWGDENIMNGQARIAASKLRATRRNQEAQLKAYAEAAFAARAAADDFVLSGAARTSLGPATAASRAEVARIIAVEGFVYADNEGNVGPMRERIEGVLDKLGAPEKLDLLRYEGKGRVSLDDEEGEWKAHLFAFVNRDTREVVSFYVREGWT